MSLALARPLFLLLQEDFDALTDPRVNRTRLHRLSDILILSLAAFCCGADGFEGIQVWSLAQGADDLRSLFGVRLDNGIPHHDTFRRVLGRLNPHCLEGSLHRLRQRLPKADGEAVAPTKHVGIDGKQIRGSHDATTGADALALLSLYATDLNLVIGQRKVDGKTNEIPVAQDVLQAVAIEGATVTGDALHCQTRTAEVIRSRGADYLLAVKENQKGLHDAIASLFAVNKQERRVPMTDSRQIEKGHGRVETRHGYLIRVADWLPDGDPPRDGVPDPLRVWKDWHSVLRIECERRWTHRGQEKRSQFVRHFISSSQGDVEQLMGFARSHWKIENNLHWIMDVTFGEDASRIRKQNEAHNVATIRRIAASLLQATEPEEVPEAVRRMSLRKRRKWAGWRPDYLQKVLSNSMRLPCFSTFGAQGCFE